MNSVFNINHQQHLWWWSWSILELDHSYIGILLFFFHLFIYPLFTYTEFIHHYYLLLFYTNRKYFKCVCVCVFSHRMMMMMITSFYIYLMVQNIPFISTYIWNICLERFLFLLFFIQLILDIWWWWWFYFRQHHFLWCVCVC